MPAAPVSIAPGKSMVVYVRLCARAGLAGHNPSVSTITKNATRFFISFTSLKASKGQGLALWSEEKRGNVSTETNWRIFLGGRGFAMGCHATWIRWLLQQACY